VEKSLSGLKIVSDGPVNLLVMRGPRGRGWGRGRVGVEDLAGLLGRPDGVLADEIEETGDVLKAGGGWARLLRLVELLAPQQRVETNAVACQGLGASFLPVDHAQRIVDARTQFAQLAGGDRDLPA
jgi:hypothetical protein